MKILDTNIAGVKLIETAPFRDHRGAFARFFCENELAPVLAGRRVAQINHSYNRETGTLRGLHLQQPPHAEMKLVRCIKGKIWDVAVDMRHGSPTFRKWYAEELTPENARMLVVPEGCAHGFQALAPDSELIYLVTQAYAPAAAVYFRYDDPAFSISWPLKVTAVSESDRAAALIKADFSGIAL